MDLFWQLHVERDELLYDDDQAYLSCSVLDDGIDERHAGCLKVDVISVFPCTSVEIVD